MIVPVVILEAQIIHERWRKDRSDADDALVRPIPVVRPVGRIAILQRLRKAVVAVVRVPDEHTILGIYVVIHLATECLGVIGAAVLLVQSSEGGRCAVYLDRLHLVGVLVVEEEEQFVLLDRPTQPKTGVPAGEERILRPRIAHQIGIRGGVVVAEKEVSAAMELVGARPGDDVDGASGRDGRGDVEIGR